MVGRMDYKPKRPWYSFRWMILFWIFLPFILIAISDILAAWLVSRRHPG
jgi:hypothetical protein